jgi:hypothetical protein
MDATVQRTEATTVQTTQQPAAATGADPAAEAAAPAEVKQNSSPASDQGASIRDEAYFQAAARFIQLMNATHCICPHPQ